MKKIILFYLIYFVFNIVIFMTAIHGIDNAYNILIFKNGITFFESNIFGQVIDGHILYNVSVYLLFFSYFTLIVVAVLLLFALISAEKKGKNVKINI